MKELVYKIVINPENTYRSTDYVNFLCSDNKVHVRLRDYDHEEVIHGFIDKLTYLVTYLFQRSAVTDAEAIETFAKQDEDIKILTDYISEFFYFTPSANRNFSGLKISKNYRKNSNKYSLLGSFKKGTCPLKDSCSFSNTTFFMDKLGLSLDDYLFNDGVELIITKDSDKEYYQKFVNKVTRKNEKEVLDYIPLV